MAKLETPSKNTLHCIDIDKTLDLRNKGFGRFDVGSGFMIPTNSQADARAHLLYYFQPSDLIVSNDNNKVDFRTLTSNKKIADLIFTTNMGLLVKILTGGVTRTCFQTNNSLWRKCENSEYHRD